MKKCSASSRVLLVETASNHHLPDLGGTCSDLVQLGVPQQASRGVVVDVTVAPCGAWVSGCMVHG